MSHARYESWGRYPASRPSAVVPLLWRDSVAGVLEAARSPIAGRGTGGGERTGHNATVLPYGLGRSYGDSCLNNGGGLIDVSRLNRFIRFDAEHGVLAAEGGVAFCDVIEIIVPRGWFLPVTPGTKFVTLGGAIANDVHGKNHHGAGTFGHHVTWLELARSSGERVACSPAENEPLFRATIGGLGLTGVILSAEFRLRKIEGPLIESETIPFASLDEFMGLAAESDAMAEYTVGWVDSLSRGRSLGRGIFFRGRHAADQAPGPRRRRTVGVPFDFPRFALGSAATSAFNTVYFNAQKRRAGPRVGPYEPFFFPLDAVSGWNRIYGRHGFLQYQCAIPRAAGTEPVREILDRVARSRGASFLTVIKTFGDIPSPGMLSFPRAGVTLSLDFPAGDAALRLLDQLDGVVQAAGGAVYPAKDARMAPEMFEASFPNWREFQKHVDPGFSSSFWRRVTGVAA
jgi:FAD/FMN-containing dehydrogenase